MKRITLLLIAILALTGCHPDKEIIKPVAKERTVLVYLIADNSLSGYAAPNIVSMQQSMDSLLGTRLIVFYNKLGGDCSLIEIEQGQKSVSEVKVLKQYPSGTNPCLPATLSQVIADTRALAPAIKGYSMIMWSHGSGWLPHNMRPARVAPKPAAKGITKLITDIEPSGAQYSFGDGLYSFSSTFEINDLAAALPSDMKFEYIAFDACFMAGVEVAYQLRDKTKYFIASSAEILGAGFPYTDAMPYILGNDAIGIARSFYNYYNAKSGVWRSATIATIDCSKLENVATELSKLVDLGGTPVAMQQFGRGSFRNLFYDLADMVHRTWGATPGFDAALKEAVVYQGATPILFEGDGGGTIYVESHCGVTVYIPRLSQPQTLSIYERNYDWAKKSNLSALAY